MCIIYFSNRFLSNFLYWEVTLAALTSFCNVYFRKFSPTILPQVLLWLLHIPFQHTMHFFVSASFLCGWCYLSPLSKSIRKTSIHPAAPNLNITTWCTFCLYLSEQKQFFASHLVFIISLCKNLYYFYDQLYQ